MKPTFLDHIVLIVKDIDVTKKFYSKFLGEPQEKYDDSISYKIGETKIFFGLPYKDSVIPDKDAEGLNHLAFGALTLEDLQKFETLLSNAGIKNRGIIKEKHSDLDFIWFDDPDGYRLEFYLRPDESSKNFVGWFKIKEKINKSKNKVPLFKEGEIWWCIVGDNVGIEVNGKGEFFTRPILVYKKLSKDGFLGLPMSTQDKTGTWYVKVKHGGQDSMVVLSQAKVFSSKRLYAKIGELDDTDCILVAQAFQDLFVTSNKKFSPPFGGVVGKSQI